MRYFVSLYLFLEKGFYGHISFVLQTIDWHVLVLPLGECI